MANLGVIDYLLHPGRTWLTLSTMCQEGISTRYWKYNVRPRILRTSPVEGVTDDRCEIHVLTSQGDWLNLIWVLKSLVHHSDRNYRLAIHEDGSLSDEALGALRQHFPQARLITRREADRRMNSVLADYPRSRQFRDGNPLALKVFDFAAFLEADRMFLLDSDILFFSRPDELIQRIEDREYTLNTLNRDWNHGYTVDADAISQELGFELQPLVNSGLGLIHRASFDLDLIEHWLGLPGVMGHPHRIEQTIIAMLSCRHGFEFLPQEYDVQIRDGLPTLPCRHYTGPIRHLMYQRGIRHLVRNGFLSTVASSQPQCV